MVWYDRMPKKKPTKVYRYDGQSIWTSSDSGYLSYSDYELGSYLGGGAAGEVYEAECFKTKRVSFTYDTCATIVYTYLVYRSQGYLIPVYDPGITPPGYG